MLISNKKNFVSFTVNILMILFQHDIESGSRQSPSKNSCEGKVVNKYIQVKLETVIHWSIWIPRNYSN